MPTCSWTGREIPFGTGKMYVKKDGKILWFSSRQAEKNFLKMKRNPRNAGYTEAARQAKSQRMAEIANVKEEEKEAKASEKKAPVKAPAKKSATKKAKSPVKKPATKKE